MIMDFILINHSEIDDNQLFKIANIKSQHWNHPVESQIAWIQKEYKKDDTHILMMDNDALVGYVAVVQLSIVADGETYNTLGISCLCVDKEYLNKGYGLLMMEQALQFAKANNKSICLLCKKKLVKFYEKCGYVVLCPKSITVNQLNYEYELMLYNDGKSGNKSSLRHAANISIDRNF